MQKLIQTCLAYRPVVVLFWLMVAIWGFFAARQLPLDAVPDITNVQVQVITEAPGLSPEDVERLITRQVELAMGGLPKLETQRSLSRFGLSVVTLVFHEGTAIMEARQLVAERLVEARSEIPESMGVPEMAPISTGLGEIFQFEVRGEGFSPMELRSILDWEVVPRLRSVPGVVEVNAMGGQLKTWEVSLDPDRLLAYGLSVDQVYTALESTNRNVGGGYLVQGKEQMLVRGEGLVPDLARLGKTLVAFDPQSQSPVYLSDLGQVSFAPFLRQGAVTRDGCGEAVIGIVMMLSGANSRQVASAVAERVQEIQTSLAQGVVLETLYDRSELVDATLKTAFKNLAEGGFLVLVVLTLFLGNWRAAAVVALAIPLSMACALIAMQALGVSGNLMSLGALDFGLVVDGSVVLVEDVLRHSRRHANDGRSAEEKVREACVQIARPVTFAVLIIVLVYLPILGLVGVEGKMFRPMAQTVVFALIGSLLIALTLMPVLASWCLTSVREQEPWVMRVLTRLYEPFLKNSMRFPGRASWLAVLLLGVGLFQVTRLGSDFMPRLDEGSIAMQIWRLPSISLEFSNELSLRAERVLKEQFPEVRTVFSRTGRAEIATDPMGVEVSDCFLMLEPKTSWRWRDKEELVAALSETLAREVPGARFSFSQPIELRMAELLSGSRGDLVLKLFGPDLEVLAEKGALAASLLRRIEGAVDVKVDQAEGLPALRIVLDHDALARNGVAAAQVLAVIEAIGGKQVGQAYEGDRSIPLLVRLKAETRQDPEQLARLPVARGGDGVQIPLGQLAKLIVETGPAQLSHEQGSRKLSIELNVRGRDLGSVVAEAHQLLAAELKLDSGYYLSWGGRAEQMDSALQRLSVLVPLVALVIFVLLYVAFRSGFAASLIYLNVPLATSGGLLALALRGYPFSISAAVGLIAAAGIAALNGVVLLSRIQENRKSRGAEDAAREAALLRLRPVLVTALVAGLGFLPMALATGSGAEVQRPLATVVIGGLITSTLLTLGLLPSLYAYFERRRGN